MLVYVRFFFFEYMFWLYIWVVIMLKGVINNVLVMVLVSVVNNVLCLLFGLKYCNKKVVNF